MPPFHQQMHVENHPMLTQMPTPSSNASSRFLSCLYRCFHMTPFLINQLLDFLEQRPPRTSAMAITHEDLSIKSYRTAGIGSKLALSLVGLSVFCGLIGFILCLAGEATRSEISWMVLTIQNSGKGYRCYYSSSGKTPLAFALVSFLLFAVAMFAEHAYMLVAITSPSSTTFAPFSAPTNSRMPSPAAKALKWQACFLFLTTWMCFAIAEVLLMIVIGVESGHLYNWTRPRVTCPAVRPGLFATAGVLGLTTVFLGVALYLTALRTQRLHLEEESMRQQQHIRPTAPHQMPPAITTYQSRAPTEASFLNKTSTSA
ncbi:hypothetical protein HPP92_001064 [Vanilla planifolia]|uniref:Uncharacterized protein n=1 Tax=Vanilla planifolia TaxID=51239 RepID=A0A835VGL0_VANPL|nr:hypothetical protein HPP92_001064 [Vanilla planifolia]